MNSFKKEWFTAFELAGKGGLPNQPSNVTRRATKNQWIKRQVEGKRGIAFEYHYSSLPPSVQEALGFSIVGSPKVPHDYIIQTPLGGEIGLEIKAGKMNRQELERALKMIEQALGLMPVQSPQPQSEMDKLNNHERSLVRYYRRSSDEGKIAIMNIAETMADLNDKKESSELFATGEVA